tara:strand:- start:149 stop:787 length:639 start_codon:yes stop_codon:yes gene_type:complete
MRRLLIPLLAALTLPTNIFAKEVINSNLPDLYTAGSIAAGKIVLECREQIEGSFNKQEKNKILKELEISKEELLDPLVNLLSDKFKPILLKDCNLDSQKGQEILSKVRNEYKFNFDQKNKRLTDITFQEFRQVTIIFALNKCRLEKGIFQTEQEYRSNINNTFVEIKLPQKFMMHKPAIIASTKIKKYLNDECTNFIIPNKQLNEKILQYYE